MSIVQKQQLSHVTNHLQKVLYLHFRMKIMPFLYPLSEGQDRGLYIFCHLYIFAHLCFLCFIFLGPDFSIVNILGPLFFIL